MHAIIFFEAVSCDPNHSRRGIHTPKRAPYVQKGLGHDSRPAANIEDVPPRMIKKIQDVLSPGSQCIATRSVREILSIILFCPVVKELDCGINGGGHANYSTLLKLSPGPARYPTNSPIA